MAQKENKKEPRRRITDASKTMAGKDRIKFPIVGIGTSAGGLEALDQFFSTMPPDSGLAFVVIQHLDPSHKGLLAELLQRNTAMKVVQATDHLPVQPDHIYVIPPNKTMAILNGHLHLFDPVNRAGLRFPIDRFFKSLADDQKENSVGIILSGMGSDGSIGIKSIKENNGIVLVQDPKTSKFNGMPESAIASIHADIVDAPEEMPGRLISLLKHSQVIRKNLLFEDKNKSNLEKIILLLRSHTGHDFSYYKNSTLYRRIERRISIHKVDKISGYVRYLQENPAELEILFKEFLIGVTGFFRDPDVWDYLGAKVLPELFKPLPNGYEIRAWVTGCSTGEEAYSLAILFKEAFEESKNEKNLTLKIFATDIDNDAIEIARKGVFHAKHMEGISNERLNRHFLEKESDFIVKSSIREMVVFAPHNVIKDPPFTKLDLLLCRNLLIYMESLLQKKLMSLFYYCLNPNGIMVLGTAENTNTHESLFIKLERKLKIYRRNHTSAELHKMDFPSAFLPSVKQIKEEVTKAKEEGDIQNFADQLLLQKFTPASVLINDDGDILYITGRTGKYLEPSAGRANMNIYAMAREGLRYELLSALRKLKQKREKIVLRNINIARNESEDLVNITVYPIEDSSNFKGSIMVVFTDVEAPDQQKVEKTKKQKSPVRDDKLELELQNALVELQSMREEMQASQEELRSTNEELQSTNEELQSTNEELTTSKEEMQSMNEELQTVNSELQNKVSEFMEANSDMKNLLNSTDIATLFLDKGLNIRRYTDQITSLFKIRASDVGRPFTDVVTELDYPEIADHAREVLLKIIPKVSDISTQDGKWFTVKIMPYLTQDERIDGLVITFLDITAAKRMEIELIEKIRLLNQSNPDQETGN